MHHKQLWQLPEAQPLMRTHSPFTTRAGPQIVLVKGLLSAKKINRFSQVHSVAPCWQRQRQVQERVKGHRAGAALGAPQLGPELPLK
mmetsp:Transcript_81282/g.153681  ORF Transcript_81282/g.153681 Transcript_81282/m.153681 type:complete len:87 (-) Transcript_81282:340-600(-)